MSNIEVGEYVRTKTNGIKRIDTIFENKTVNKYGYEIGSEWDGKLYSTIKTTDVINHSFNIIDLIEVGDYVNGKRVIKIMDYEEFKKICFDEDFDDVAYEEDIKSIVTWEMMKSVEYRVE